jgi:hypothetical protein
MLKLGAAAAAAPLYSRVLYAMLNAVGGGRGEGEGRFAAVTPAATGCPLSVLA